MPHPVLAFTPSNPFSESPPRCRASTAQALPLPWPSSLARATSAPRLSPEYWQCFLTSDRSSDKSDAAVAAGLPQRPSTGSTELSRSLSDLKPITSLNAALATSLQHRGSSRSSSAARREHKYCMLEVRRESASTPCGLMVCLRQVCTWALCLSIYVYLLSGDLRRSLPMCHTRAMRISVSMPSGLKYIAVETILVYLINNSPLPM